MDGLSLGFSDIGLDAANFDERSRRFTPIVRGQGGDIDQEGVRTRASRRLYSKLRVGWMPFSSSYLLLGVGIERRED